MTENRHVGPLTLRLALHLAPAACIALALTACVADGSHSLSGPQLAVAPAQPRLVTYNCGDDGAMTVEAMTNAVHLVDPEGASYDLPASPPTQGSRFGEAGVALVVEEGEALWMKAGREPVTCRR